MENGAKTQSSSKDFHNLTFSSIVDVDTDDLVKLAVSFKKLVVEPSRPLKLQSGLGLERVKKEIDGRFPTPVSVSNSGKGYFSSSISALLASESLLLLTPLFLRPIEVVVFALILEGRTCFGVRKSAGT